MLYRHERDSNSGFEQIKQRSICTALWMFDVSFIFS
jgi:hypothetical protein